MFKFDHVKARAHRRAQAKTGFPLLRGCANTQAIRLVAYLDGLSTQDQRAFAEQLSDLAEAQSQVALPLADRSALIQSLPLVAGFFAPQDAPPRRPEVRFMPVKLLAALVRDHGSLAEWADFAGVAPEACKPAPGHAASVEDLVPVAPRRLRKLIGDAIGTAFSTQKTAIASDHTRYGAEIASGRLMIDVLFSPPGPRGMHQFRYALSVAGSGGGPAGMLSYESLWLTADSWDYVTESNAERSVAHFLTVIRAALEML